MDRYIVATDKFTKGKRIGGGNFGDVYRGQDLRETPPRDIAVKVVRVMESYGDGVNFARELCIMAMMKHPATLPLVGFTISPEIIIITPLMANGTVEDMVKCERKGTAPRGWNATAKSKLIIGVSAAMAYIHSKGVLHRDLKAANIFLNDKFEPVVADFGVSRMQGLNVTVIGTPLYMAPDLFKEDPNDLYTQAVDVFAFAVFLRQLFTASLELDDERGPIRGEHQLYGRILRGARLKRVPEIPDFYWQLITDCWVQDPEQRPTFVQIIRTLLETDEWIFPGTDLEALREYQNRILEGIQVKNIYIADISDDESDDVPPIMTQTCQPRRFG